MIKLNSDTFRRAIEKAQTVSPTCNLLDTDGATHTFQVAKSGGGFSIVDIWPQGGTLWTSCDCAAGSGIHRRGFPQPCYHVAAAALSLGLFVQAMPVGAVLEPAPERAAGRQVPPQLIDLSELAPLPTTEPVTAPAPAPHCAPSKGLPTVLARVARWLGRVFWFSARSARA